MITQITDDDAISMKLLHYFITKKNYTPMIVQGVENEIWLENLDANYKIVRIVNAYIHNDEQMDFDVFKVKRMIKKVKKKTFTLKIKVLSIIIDYGENVDTKRTFDNVDVIYYEDEEKLLKNKIIKDFFPDLSDNLQYTEEGFQLFLKITNEINKKNMKESQETDRILKPKTPIVTYTILGLITIIYLLSLVYNPNLIVLYFGVYGDLIRDGQVYRLLTGAFIHINLIHFLTNSYSLYMIGNLAESYYGKKKFIVIYLVSAITASLLSIAMHNTFSIGASGAIFGLLGSLLYFGYHYRVYFGNVLIKQIAPIIVINLLIGFSITGIDNFAHIGGLIGGFLISKALGVNSKDKKSDKVNGIILTIIYVIFICALALIKR